MHFCLNLKLARILTEMFCGTSSLRTLLEDLMLKISVSRILLVNEPIEAYLSLKCLNCIRGRFKFVISLSLGIRISTVKCQIGWTGLNKYCEVSNSWTGLGKLIQAQAGLKGLF